jgi:hypothetical protein
MTIEDESSALSETTRKSAETLYQSLRTELIERVKLRDQILIAYLGAVAALVGVALGPGMLSSSQHQTLSLLSALLVLVPTLSLGATAMICHHQEIMSVFTKYIALELNQWFCSFPIYDRSRARRDFGSRAEFHILVSQVSLLCGPWCFILLLNWPFDLSHIGQKEILLFFGFIIDAVCLFRLISARNFRRRVLEDIYIRKGSH